MEGPCGIRNKPREKEARWRQGPRPELMAQGISGIPSWPGREAELREQRGGATCSSLSAGLGGPGIRRALTLHLSFLAAAAEQPRAAARLRMILGHLGGSSVPAVVSFGVRSIPASWGTAASPLAVDAGGRGVLPVAGVPLSLPCAVLRATTPAKVTAQTGARERGGGWISRRWRPPTTPKASFPTIGHVMVSSGCYRVAPLFWAFLGLSVSCFMKSEGRAGEALPESATSLFFACDVQDLCECLENKKCPRTVTLNRSTELLGRDLGNRQLSPSLEGMPVPRRGWGKPDTLALLRGNLEGGTFSQPVLGSFPRGESYTGIWEKDLKSVHLRPP